jgi:iron(III) transport system permease protein
VTTSTKTLSQPTLILWILVGWVSFLLLPWYLVDGGLFSGQWLVDGYPFDKNYAPAAFLIMQGEKLWLTPLLIPLIMPLFAFKREKSDPLYAQILILTGAIGFSWLIIQGFSIGIRASSSPFSRRTGRT